MDESAEVYTAQKIRSTREMDELGEGDAIEEALKKKKDDRYEEEKKLVNKAVPKRKKWLSWRKKQLKGASDPHSEIHSDHKKAPRTEPAKAPDKASSKPEKTCVEGHDRVATARDKENLEGPHVLHNMKYGSENLLGMKTKYSAVEGTKEGRVQTVEALAYSGASASIISWDLQKKVTMIGFEKGDATRKDANLKHMDVSGRGEIMVQEEHGMPHKIKVPGLTRFGQE